jgi:signal transduction histidine kinase
MRAARLRPAPKPLDLPLLLDDLAGIARAGAESNGLEFVARFADDLPERIEADGRRIRQILINLIDNAIKYTEHGRIALHVWGGDRSADRIRLGFAVEDTGRGIAQSDRERIFAPFEQSDPDKPGAGLGLPICRDFAGLLGGRLTLESEPGRGSRFELHLPVGIIEVMPIPSRMDLAALLDFAETGDRALILDWCLNIIHADVRFKPFANRVLDLIEGVDTSKLAEWLKRQ